MLPEVVIPSLKTVNHLYEIAISFGSLGSNITFKIEKPFSNLVLKLLEYSTTLINLVLY